MTDWSILDTLGDRAAVDLIAKLLDGTEALPFGGASDERCLAMCAARLRRLALACDVDKATTSNRFDMNTVVGTALSPTKPGALDIVKVKDLIASLAEVPELPHFVQCDYLDGLKDENGNPAAFMVNSEVFKAYPPRLVMTHTPGKTQNLVLLTPQFAKLLADEAAKQAIKITIENRK